MGFGLNVKVETPKVEVPKVDIAAAAKNAASSATSAISGTIDSAKSAVDSAKSAVDSAKSTVSSAIESANSVVEGAVATATDAAESVKSSLAAVAGAIAEVAVTFKSEIEDIVLEPHLSLDANASWKDTKFEKGPIWVRMELPSNQAKDTEDLLHLFSSTRNFDEQKEVRDFVESTPDTIDILFENVPMNEKYSLELIRKDGFRKIMFRNVAYGDLRETRNRFI